MLVQWALVAKLCLTGCTLHVLHTYATQALCESDSKTIYDFTREPVIRDFPDQYLVWARCNPVVSWPNR